MSRNDGFTITELLVSVAILALLVSLLAGMFIAASRTTTWGTQHLEVDAEARAVLDRMGVDFSQFIRRGDLDAYVKGVDAESGNDHIAFFCSTAGYYPSAGSQSPISLVAYRINADTAQPSFGGMERMGKGLVWNGDSGGTAPLIFGLSTISATWPSAADSVTADADYEVVAPGIFRFEYFYILNDGTVAVSPPPGGIPAINGICVVVAALDSRNRLLLTRSQMSALTDALTDFSPSQPNLAAAWQASLSSLTTLPKAAVSAVRIYQRSFYLAQN